jgi:hypothetical protein
MVRHSAFRTFEPVFVVRKAGGGTSLFVLLATGFCSVGNPLPILIFEVITNLIELHTGPRHNLSLKLGKKDWDSNNETRKARET